MSKSILLWLREQQRVVPWWLGLSALAGAAPACNASPDETSVQPAAGSGGGGSGGSSGSGGSGGAADDRDAGADATADTGAAGGSCVVGTLEHFCTLEACPPTFAAARSEARHMPNIPSIEAKIIVQRACSAPDGSPRISVSADYTIESKAFIYDAATEQLVGVQLIDDTGDCHHGPAPADDHGFGEVHGYYGEVSPDCHPGFPGRGSFFIPEACNWDYPPRGSVLLDAGTGDAGTPDANPEAGPHECILAP